ncbi:MAG: hypothetical protein NZ927_00565 [Candidatus Calescibacterium sp.]|nr:hypothetical protein [Candidatus Calescibacterium sp.]MDW8086642.1 hypothetical protein [Candidatus Calescibacterium sp.]
MTRFYRDFKKEDSFEDIFEIKQRFFIEQRYNITEESFFFNFSGKIDLDYFQGGFNRFSYSVYLYEFYFGMSFGNFNLSAGRKIVTWGIVDGSPLDVVNRPDFSEGLFNEPRFLKTPSIVTQLIGFSGSSSIDFVYEPFFTPPNFADIGGDWAILNWSSLNSSFEGDRSNPQLKNILNGLVSPIVRSYPKEITEMLLSFGAGFQFKTSFENLNFAFVSYTASSIFPIPFFEQTFIDYFERSPQTFSEKFNISALEIVEPASRGEPFIRLEPRRYYLLGGGWSYDIDGYLLKNDLAFYLLNDLPDENLKVREFNIMSWAVDLEREIIPNFFVIPSFRGILKLSPANDIIVVENGVFLPSFSARYEFFIGNSSISLLGNLVLDVPFDLDIRSYFSVVSFGWKPVDTIELSILSYIFGGDQISLFGFFENNSALSLWIRLYF